MDIEQQLERLDDLRDSIAALRLNYDALRRAALPDEVLAALAALEAEYLPAIQTAELAAAELEADIKRAVVAHGATVKGNCHLMAVYTAGRVTWDTRRIDGYAAAHPELLEFRKTGEPTVSIRERK